MNTVTEFSPAKINLFLAITGRRADGFHNLVSVAAPLDFGDELVVTAREGGFALECDHPDVPVDASNLILRAAEAFVGATDWKGGAHFQLKKRIPMGAGLGGGSSNAVAALRALNRLSGNLLGEPGLVAVAARLGSDCVLFLKRAPVVMRGRGERVEMLSDEAAFRLRGRRVLLFKPSFGISTPWAYKRMIVRGTDYLAEDAAEQRLAGWLGGAAAAESLVFNNMEAAAFEKYVALPVLLEKLRTRFGVTCRMSGSGSACYVLLPENCELEPLVECVQASWGEEVFWKEARLT